MITSRTGMVCLLSALVFSACPSTKPVGPKTINRTELPSGLAVQLSTDVQLRINSLLSRGFTPCEVGGGPVSVPLKELLDSGINGPMNCFATAAFVLLGDQSGFIEGRYLVDHLQSAGYKRVGNYATQEYDEHSGWRQGWLKGTLERRLKTGDALVFSSVIDSYSGSHPSTTSYNHAAIFLGQINGRDLVFQKPDYGCAQVSPFEVVEFNSLLVKYGDKGDSVEIYRK